MLKDLNNLELTFNIIDKFSKLDILIQKKNNL